MHHPHTPLFQEILQLPFVSSDPAIPAILNLKKLALDGHWRILATHPDSTALSTISIHWLQDLLHNIQALCRNFPQAPTAWLATHLFEEFAELLQRFRVLRLTNTHLPHLVPFLISH